MTWVSSVALQAFYQRLWLVAPGIARHDSTDLPSELHVYTTGGHGYGLRRTEHYVTTWPDRAADWMRGRGLLKQR